MDLRQYVLTHYQILNQNYLQSPAGNKVVIGESGKGRYVLVTDPTTKRRARVYLEGLVLTPVVHHKAVMNYRREYREKIVANNYSVLWHFGLVNIVPILSIVFASYWAGGLLQHWPLVLLTLLGCNLGEWYDHYYNLHRPSTRNRHTTQHHRFFTDHLMSYDSFQDGHVIFFPPHEPFLLVILALVVSLPVWSYCLSAMAVVFRTLMFYYWCYEWLHLAYHAPPTSWIGRLPCIAYLRQHHQNHHRQTLMRRYNFNITLPLADWMLGTYYRK